MGNQRKNFLVYLGVISVIIAGFFILFDGGIGSTEEIPMSSVISLTENPPIGQRVNILVKGDELEVISGNQTYTSRKDMESNGANTITNTSLALKFVDTEKLNTYNRWTLYICTGFYVLLFIAVALQKLNETKFTTISSTSS